MDIQDILTRFALIANLGLEEASPWITICSEAKEEIERKVKANVNINNNSRRLTAAAAALAFYRYSLYRASGDGMGSFSAGNVKITQDKKAFVKSAKQVWLESRKSVADILQDEDFLFENINIC